MKTKNNLNSSEVPNLSTYAEKIGCFHGDLLMVMNFESRLDPTVRGGANNAYVGLIQFSAISANEIGTTQKELIKMDFDQQMLFVVKYFQMWRKRLKLSGVLSLADLYLLVLYPSAIKTKGFDTPLTIAGKQAETLYVNGVITRRSIENAIKNFYNQTISKNGNA